MNLLLTNYKINLLIVPLLFQDFPAIQTRKRSSEATSLLPRKGISDLIDNEAALTAWKRNKRKKATFSEEQGRLQVKESINIQEHKVIKNACERVNHIVLSQVEIILVWSRSSVSK